MMREEVIEILKKEICSVSEAGLIRENIKPTDRLMVELGLDSLGYAEVYTATEELLGVSVNESSIKWAEVRTVEQLADVLHQAQERR